MAQHICSQVSPEITRAESQNSLKAEFAGNIRSFVASTLGKDEPVNRMLGDAAFRSEVMYTLTTCAHGK